MSDLSPSPAGPVKLRIRFSKLGKVRWTSHRDVARMWERAFRRVRLELAYSEGYSPRPKVAFGLALPTGHESLAEYLDVELIAGADVGPGGLEGLVARLSDALPAGVDATAAIEIPPGTSSLQEAVTSCDWRWRVGFVDAPGIDVPEEWLTQQAASVMAASELVITRQRKGKEIEEDIRPSILDLKVTQDGWVEADLASQPRSIRPADVIAAFEPVPKGQQGASTPSGPSAGIDQLDVRRIAQWISRDGARREPIELSADATGAAHAWGRAS